MLYTKVVDKIETHTSCSIFFFGGWGVGGKIRLWDKVKKYFRAGQAMDDK
jgi:hypothetical protein